MRYSYPYHYFNINKINNDNTDDIIFNNDCSNNYCSNIKYKLYYLFVFICCIIILFYFYTIFNKL